MKRIWIALIALNLLLLAGCGPKTLSDQEFSETASNVCISLKKEVKQYKTLDFIKKADSYDKAVNSLKGLKIAEETSPNSVVFFSALDNVSKKLRIVGVALDAALSKTDLSGNIQVMIGDDGTVFANTKIFDIQSIDMDGALFTDLIEADKQLSSAADKLELSDCKIINFILIKG